MNWQCVECGRPHADDRGTCECGSERYERATFKAAKRCTECGEPAPGRDTYCRNCGFTSFEPIGDDEPMPDPDYEEWRCTNCGKEYPKHTPPCDRCGSMDFEKARVTDVDVADYVGNDAEPWLSKWTVVAVAAIVAGLVLVTVVL